MEVAAGPKEGESLFLIIMWFSGKTHIFKLSFPELVELAEQTDDIIIKFTGIQIK